MSSPRTWKDSLWASPDYGPDIPDELFVTEAELREFVETCPWYVEQKQRAEKAEWERDLLEPVVRRASHTLENRYAGDPAQRVATMLREALKVLDRKREAGGGT